MNDEVREPRIACAHLYDDFSGSAKVFSHAITELLAAGARVQVIVGSAGESGFIRSVHRAKTVFYRFSENRLLLLLLFANAQALLFLRVLLGCLCQKIDVVYANTVLAPGALLAGWLCRRRLVIHVHEVGLGSRSLFKALLAISRMLGDRFICVSEYTRNALDLPHQRTTVLYNSLSPEEWLAAQAIAAARIEHEDAAFVVMMACSLKWYKGLDSFLALAAQLSAEENRNLRPIRFRLLLNCSSAEWRDFAARHVVSPNVTVVLRPADVYQYYRDASLVLNLSHPEGWIETFGMTLLEAMSCGVPVISPLVGGCTELFQDGEGGWRIGSRNLAAIISKVRELAGDRSLWLAASAASRANAEKFNPGQFSRGLRAAVIDVNCDRRRSRSRSSA